MASFSQLSRKELQALCKSNGIPANKTNVFMMEALAKKRVPLSQVDANKELATIPRVAKKADSFGPTLKPPVFTNNFLKRGKRKDPPPSDEIEQERQKDAKTASATGLQKSSTDVLSKAGDVQMKVESEYAHVTRKEVKVIVSGPICLDKLTSPAKERIEDRVRSQIDAAALCSVQLSKVAKVVNVPMENSEEQQKELEDHALPDAPSTLAVPKSNSVTSGVASPPVTLSPLVRLEEKVRSVVDRIHNFWKSRESPVVNSFGSPVQ